MSVSGRRHRRAASQGFSAYDALVLGGSPVAYLQFSGGHSGFADLTGNGHNVTAAGPLGSASFLDGYGAAVFDGTSSGYAEIPNDTALSVPATGILAVEAWISPSVLQFTNFEGSGYVYWAGKLDPETSEAEWACRMYNQANSENRPNRISGYAFNLTGGFGAGSYFQDPVTTGAWIHYVLVINTLNTSSTYPTGYTKIYKNGIYRDQDSLSGYSIVPAHGTAPFRVGTASRQSFFNGAIARVALYNYEPTAAQVYAHYSALVPGTPGSAQYVGPAGSAASQSPGTRLALPPIAASISAGSTVIVRAAHSYTSAGPTCSDSQGNTYTRDRTAANAGNTMRASLFRGQIDNALRPGDTIYLTTPAVTAERVMAADVFNHVIFNADGTVLDVINGSTGTSAAPGTSDSITTTHGDDLLIGGLGVAGPSTDSFTGDPAWPNLPRSGTAVGSGDMTSDGAYQTPAATGTFKWQPALGASQSWVHAIAAYKAGVPTVTPTPQGTAAYAGTVGTAADHTGTGTTLTVTVPAPGIAAGHTLIVRACQDYTSSSPTCSDSQGNTYTVTRSGHDSGNVLRGTAFHGVITTALNAGDTITVTFPAAGLTRAAAVDHFTSVLSPVVIDAQNGAAGTSTAPSVAATTTHANDLLIGAVFVAGDVADGYTEDLPDLWKSLPRAGTTGGTASADRTVNTAYRPVGVTGTFTYAPVLATSSVWIAFLLAYEAT